MNRQIGYKYDTNKVQLWTGKMKCCEALRQSRHCLSWARLWSNSNTIRPKKEEIMRLPFTTMLNIRKEGRRVPGHPGRWSQLPGRRATVPSGGSGGPPAARDIAASNVKVSNGFKRWKFQMVKTTASISGVVLKSPPLVLTSSPLSRAHLLQLGHCCPQDLQSVWSPDFFHLPPATQRENPLSEQFSTLHPDIFISCIWHAPTLALTCSCSIQPTEARLLCKQWLSSLRCASIHFSFTNLSEIAF